MPKETKGWSKARRARQAANIRRIQPWKNTTGPRTPEGKAAAAQNALKSGLHTAEIRALKRLLHQQRKNLRDLSRLHV